MEKLSKKFQILFLPNLLGKIHDRQRKHVTMEEKHERIRRVV